MASQRFCLRWNNHQSNLLSVFDQLLHAETFTDVTLAVDGQLLKAHKMVLSACSPYFQALFVNHQEKHPIVILKDVSYSDMKSLLDFMYRGEVSVDQERLTAFLRVAESLRIKGLTEVKEDKCDVPSAGLPPQLHRLHRNVNNLPQTHPGLTPQQQQNAGLLLPLLGGMQPKRKRGRPRKLSGGDDPMDGQGTQRDSSGQRNSAEPERLEIAVGADGFQGGDDQASGDEEALLIDEGDEQPPSSPQNLSDTQGLSRYFLDEDHPNATPVITLELLSRSGTISHSIQTRDEESGVETELERPTLVLDSNSGVHFLTDDQANSLFTSKLEPGSFEGDESDDALTLSPPRSKQELLEYMIRGDGSVVCKLCGEILQSRTHWYRHKYKFHVTPSASPAPLFRCEQCSVFFKSRKGYIGHLASRHPENDENLSEIPAIESSESVLESTIPAITIKQELEDAELAIPRCELPNTNYTNSESSSQCGNVLSGNSNPTMPNIVMNPAGVIRNEGKARNKCNKGNDTEIGGVEWEKQRRREERLVADIIARVKKECEESGGQQATSRRGYSRRSALTNG